MTPAATIRLASNLAFVSVLVCVAPVVSAQRASSLSFQTLRAEVAQAQTMRGVIELRARWSEVASAQAAGAEPITILSRRDRPGTLRRERRPELSSDRLVVVVVDRQQVELDWRMIANPRIIRAEVPGADGHFTGEVITNTSADLLFTVPDLPGAVAVRIYQPEATATGYVLNLVAEFPLTTP